MVKKRAPVARETPEERTARLAAAHAEGERMRAEKKADEERRALAYNAMLADLKMPERRYNPQVANFPLWELVRRWEKRREETALGGRGHWLTDREFVMGYPLPEFQRPPVWKEEQQASFIESIWLGLSPGSYVVNDFHHGEWVKAEDREGLHPYFWLLLDGQQRLRAIQAYLEGKFKVLGYHWSDLNELEHRRFGDTQFARVSVYLTTDEQLRDFYNRMNFGGTPHTEEQRA